MPFEVIAELLPRMASGRVRYNSIRAELRFSGAAAPSNVTLIPTSDATAKRAAPTRPGTRAHRRRIVVDAAPTVVFVVAGCDFTTVAGG